MSRTTLSRPYAVFWSLVFTTSGALVILSQVAEEAATIVDDPVILDLMLPGFMVLCAVVLTVLSLQEWESVWDILIFVVVLSLAVAPTFVGVVADEYGWPTWLLLPALAFWMIAAVAAVSTNTDDLWTQFLLWLGAATSIVTLICTIGLYGPIPFARQLIDEARSISVVLDLRLTLAALFTSLVLVTAVVRAYAEPWPEIPRLPKMQIPRLPSSRTFLSPVMNPPIMTLNAVLLVLTSVVNVLWGAAVMVVWAIIRIGVEFGSLLWSLLFHSKATVRLLRGMTAATAVFGVVIVALEGTPLIRLYLLADHARLSETVEVITIGSGILIASTLIALALEGREFVTHRALFGASLVATILLMSGGIVYAIAATDLLEISGWSRLGLITITGLVLIGFGAIGSIIINVTEAPVQAKSDRLT